MRVRHKVYGRGVAIDEEWHSNDTFLNVRFDIPHKCAKADDPNRLYVGKAALVGDKPSEGYVRKYRSKSLAERFLPLARAIAHDMATVYDLYEDIEMAAFEGLCQAADRYDGDIGTFEAYARPYIEGTIYKHWRREAKSNQEFNADGTFWNSMTDQNDDLSGVELEELYDSVKKAVSQLKSDKQRLVIELRYLVPEPWSWAEISSLTGVSRIKLDDLRKKAIRNLKKEMCVK